MRYYVLELNFIRILEIRMKRELIGAREECWEGTVAPYKATHKDPFANKPGV